MHDEWFDPMAAETRAFLRLTREEAPDFIAILRSHESHSSVEPTAYVPRTVKEDHSHFLPITSTRAIGLPACRPPSRSRSPRGWHSFPSSCVQSSERASPHLRGSGLYPRVHRGGALRLGA